MVYENIINRAKYLFVTENKEMKSCVEQAVNELVPVKTIVELSLNYDITKSDLVDDVYNKMLRGEK